MILPGARENFDEQLKSINCKEHKLLVPLTSKSKNSRQDLQQIVAFEGNVFVFL